MGELDYIAKGEKTVNGQYRFVSHDAVTAKIHPLLVKHKLLVIPSVQELTQEGNRTSVKLFVTFINAENAQEQFTICFYGYGVDSGDKGPGKAISYAFKYALLKTFCLETGDDPDNDAKALYEPVKCLEFDGLIPVGFTDKERKQMQKFLTECAESMNKHVEDVKREAIARMPEFLNAFKNWVPKKKEEM